MTTIYVVKAARWTEYSGEYTDHTDMIKAFKSQEDCMQFCQAMSKKMTEINKENYKSVEYYWVPVELA